MPPYSRKQTTATFKFPRCQFSAITGRRSKEMLAWRLLLGICSCWSGPAAGGQGVKEERMLCSSRSAIPAGVTHTPLQPVPPSAGSATAARPLPFPGTPRVLSLPPRQPRLAPHLLPPAPRTPGSAAAPARPGGSRPPAAPRLRTRKPPAAPGLRALLEGKRKREGSGSALGELLAERLQLITSVPFPRWWDFWALLTFSHDAEGARCHQVWRICCLF